MIVISYNISKITQSWEIKKFGKRESEREKEKKEDQKGIKSADRKKKREERAESFLLTTS